MKPGKPCLFVEIGKGCKDYENRPTSPCKTYQCYWKLQEQVPEEYKPEKSGVIMSWSDLNGIKFLDITRSPNEPSVEMLSWIFVHTKSHDMNLRWSEGPRLHWIGSVEFCQAMKEYVDNSLYVPYTSPSR